MEDVNVQEHNLNNESESRKPTRLWIVRHAQSQANVGEAYTGEPSLTELGVQQARALGKQFAEKGIRFNSVVTSGSARAMQTAEGILEQLGIEAAAKVNQNLREKREGKISSEDRDTVFRQFKDILKSLPDEKRWDYIPEIEGFDTTHFETERAAADRFEEGIREVVHEHPGENVLVVTHHMSMAAYLSRLHETGLLHDDDSSEGSLFSRYGPRNTGYFVVEANKDENGLKDISVIERNLKISHDTIQQIPQDQSAPQVATALQRVRSELRKLLQGK